MNIHMINCIPDALFECAGFIVPRCRFASVMAKWDYRSVPVAVTSFCFLHWYNMLLSKPTWLALRSTARLTAAATADILVILQGDILITIFWGAT